VYSRAAACLRLRGFTGSVGKRRANAESPLLCIVPSIFICAIVGDVAGGVIGVTVTADRADFVAGAWHRRGGRAAVDFGQAVAGGIIGIGARAAAVFLVQTVEGIVSVIGAADLDDVAVIVVIVGVVVNSAARRAVGGVVILIVRRAERQAVAVGQGVQGAEGKVRDGRCKINRTPRHIRRHAAHLPVCVAGIGDVAAGGQGDACDIPRKKATAGLQSFADHHTPSKVFFKILEAFFTNPMV
jgi:hypothetical protein